MTDLTLEEQRLLAEASFPLEWAEALLVPDERGRRRRTNLRKRAIYLQKIRPLREAGAKCGSCKHFGHVPVSKKRCCDLGNDFHGYAIREASDLCPDWSGA